MLEPFTLRTKDEIARFFDGFDLVDPDAAPTNPDAHLTAYYGSLAHLP